MAKKKAKKKALRSKEKLDAGLLVSERVQLKDVRMVSSKCDQSPGATSGKKTYDIDYSTEVQVDRKSGYVVVIAKFHFEAFTESKASQPVILIDASFLLSYRIENFEGLTQKGFERFANLNGVYNAWPYWREFVQNTIVRMGLPSLSIHVFRIVEPLEKKTISRKTAKKKVKSKAISRK
jgi:preprotein translocase subunit SecB